MRPYLRGRLHHYEGVLRSPRPCRSWCPNRGSSVGHILGTLGHNFGAILVNPGQYLLAVQDHFRSIGAGAE